MKKIACIGSLFVLLLSCNDSATGSSSPDGSLVDTNTGKDNTRVYDTSTGVSTDTNRTGDTMLLPNKMYDTGIKK